MASKLWEKNTEVNQEIEKFTVGRDRELDLYLARYDVLGSMAHITMLESIGLLGKDEQPVLLEELRRIHADIEAGRFIIEEGVEDVHSQVELLLTRKLGDVGKKIHSGRSRNDQVLVDLKLFTRAQLQDIAEEVRVLFEELQAQSERYKGVLMPGYTHLQVAMPSSFGLWFGAYAESLVDDLLFLQAAYKMTNRNPLGSAAGYGSSFPLNRTLTTELLGFDSMNYNVVYAQMGRGKMERNVAFALAGIAGTLSKLAFDACLFNSQNFGFVKLPDNCTTGSSIMPHKKNPDVFELTRAKCNKIQALPQQIILIMNNLPCGYFRDLHLLQELYYNRGDGTRYGLSAWYLRSKRGLPFLSTDYRDDVTILNEQREQTLRAVASWERLRERLKLGAKLGYAYTASAYDFRQRNAQGAQSDLTLSRSYLHTPYGQFDAEYYVGRRWLFTGNVALHVPMVDCSDKSPYHEGDVYDRYRVELSGHLSAKWRPTERIGLAVNLRGELYDRHAVPLIPAFFFDWVVSERGNVVLKASVARNYRYPTLNDRYYQPGGNPDLRPEHGFTYDGGISFALGGEAEGYTLRGKATLFDSHIDDWILWVQARRGYWTPRNVRKVHNYGAETKVDASVRLSPDWRLGLDAHFAWTPSINYGEPVNDADASYGKQLVYVPEYAAAATATLGWRRWTLVYKWNYYSERYTTTSNDTSLRTGRLEPYYMSDLSLERSFALRWADLSLKGVVRNLFNVEYVTVLSRPMPGINFELFIGITPKFGKNKKKSVNTNL